MTANGNRSAAQSPTSIAGEASIGRLLAGQSRPGVERFNSDGGPNGIRTLVGQELTFQVRGVAYRSGQGGANRLDRRHGRD